MKFSETWLREWVDPKVSCAELIEQLTMAGLEVDGVETLGDEFEGVVIGEIVAVEPHPDAEKLRVCQVKGANAALHQVVCGAPNARVGIKVPFATVGARLPDGTVIKQAKLRGVESHGMLCAAIELALGDDDSGLLELPEAAVAGESLQAFLALDDRVIEVDLTPNRGDCLSIRGLAREVGALNQAPVVGPEMMPFEPKTDIKQSVELQAKDACPVYAGRVVTGVDCARQTPVWMRERLRRCGVRSINPVVDVTNYVMLELGQPMHAFDCDRLQGAVQVRFANPGETLTLLDEQQVELTGDTLIIADDAGALAMAGIMGGNFSAVTTQTCNVFLESAFFSPQAIAGKARAYGLHTDSSHRFERGVDSQLQRLALERATELLTMITGGEPGPVVFEADQSHLAKATEIELRHARLTRLLGEQLDGKQVEGMLTRLGLEVLARDEGVTRYRVPSHRFDLAIEADLVEEVARLHGYDRLPKRTTQMAPTLQTHSEQRIERADIKRRLVSRGYREAITYSFIDPKLHELFFPEQDAVALANPISSDMAVMRTSLLPGLLQTLQHNLNRQQERIKLFESGQTFVGNGQDLSALVQQDMIAGLVYGTVGEVSWAEKPRAFDFFDIKGDLENLMALAHFERFEFKPTQDHHHMHPGQCAAILQDGRPQGVIGALHPTLSKKLGLGKPVFVFECRLSALQSRAPVSFAPLSRYPSVTRDLAVVVGREVRYCDLDQTVRETAGELLKELKLFDLYCGEGIDPERKSLAFSLTFQRPSSTLKDDEINSLMAQLVDRLKSDYGASLR